MKRNPAHPGTYAGQPARIVVGAKLSDGSILFALKTAGGTLATDYHTTRWLREFAAEKHLALHDEQNYHHQPKEI